MTASEMLQVKYYFTFVASGLYYFFSVKNTSDSMLERLPGRVAETDLGKPLHSSQRVAHFFPISTLQNYIK